MASPAPDHTAQLARDLTIANLGRVVRATYEALGTEWVSAETLAKGLGYANGANTAPRLKKLFERGLVERTGTGVSGDAYRWRKPT